MVMPPALFTGEDSKLILVPLAFFTEVPSGHILVLLALLTGVRSCQILVTQLSSLGYPLAKFWYPRLS